MERVGTNRSMLGHCNANKPKRSPLHLHFFKCVKDTDVETYVLHTSKCEIVTNDQC